MILRWILTIGMMLGPCLSVYAEQYALLVGVNRYPNLAAQFQLNGAVNDVKQLAQILKKSGFQDRNLSILSDEPGARFQANRQVILAQLTDLSERVGPGDLVLTYFALHGSQQPVLRPKRHNEADDLDEILLPSDVKKWDGTKQRVENAIVDDELDMLFSRMRQRGAFVVAGFDTCHAGTMARGVNLDNEKDRFVPMNALGIPHQLQKKKGPTRGVSLDSHRFVRTQNQTQGGFVGLYASQSDQLTKEFKSGDQDWHGVFSYHFLRVLTDNPKASYRQLGEQILAAYRTEKRWLSSPQFEGRELDYQALTLTPLVSTQQWAIEKQKNGLYIPAGSLHQFDLGARFSLHQTATSDRAVAYAKAAEIFPDYARLVIEKPGQTLEAGALDQLQFARLQDPRFQQVIRIKVHPSDKLLHGLTARLKAAKATIGVDWIEDGKADYVLAHDRSRGVCFVRSDIAPICRHQIVKLHEKLKQKLKQGQHDDRMLVAIQDAARKLSVAHRLSKIAATLNPTEALNQVELKLHRVEKGHAHLLDIDDPRLVLTTGQQLRLHVKNSSNRAVDVTVLSLNQEMGIQSLFPEVPGANRVEANGEQEVSLKVHPQTLGREQIFVFVSEVQALRSSDFGFLEQSEIGYTAASSLAQDRWRGQALESLTAMLGVERGQKGLSKTAIRTYTWTTR